ncbi:MAG: hypothetical protein HYU24_09670 [Candidatus Rokubacteria bacterium]|nr:hypothetical protein [Candidatus Rokubacteria bacterium]
MRLEVLNPQAATIEHTAKAAHRPPDLRGKRVGLYWNLKAGGDHALTRTAERLGQRFPGATFKRYWGEVGSLFRMATAADVERIAAECDAVIGTTSD